MNDIDKIIRQILKDVKVGLKAEFDQNFEREAFFTEKWARRKHGDAGRAVLTQSGALRKSIHSRMTADSIVFYSDLPYAAIHNEGGEIKVTARTKSYFRAKYRETRGQFRRKKDGTLRNDKKNRRLSSEAGFYKAMALKKEGSMIVIPKRQFLGLSPEVERTVREIIEENLSEYFNHNFKLL